MKNVTFGRVLSICFIVAIILTVINSHTLRNSLIHSAIFAILGITLFIIPVYPAFLENRYDKERCVVIERGIAIAVIVPIARITLDTK